MRRILRRRPSPAMMVACIALLVALGGTSVAAVSALPRNSVGTAQLQNRSVTTPKIRPNAVTSQQVRNRSLLAVDFKLGQLPQGPSGPAGPPGPTGPKGDKGDTGTIGAITVRTNTVVVDGGTAENGAYITRAVSRNCDSDEKAIAGGGGWSDQDDNLELTLAESKPVITSNNVVGWTVRGGNDSGQSSTLTVYALCYKG